ncbi:aldehyde dehydrogenase family protein [Halomarina litorea]|uniref:aldehyde dehydrogenase family protein n=1 Tax=Halomarina litorea TaxID=2961595 RepID=UPI0020C2327D|nr:aldehyde dehydrogenase family protein [Halomarina sp. BCD28]
MSQSTAEERDRYSPDADWNQLYLDGPVDGDDRDTIAVDDPATEEVFTEVPAGTVEDVDRAYEVASEAQAEWAETSPQERTEVIQGALQTMEERREEILELLAVESGSTRVKGEVELQSAMGITQEAASFPTRMSGDHRDSNVPGKENVVKREPAGVVAVISPWNFPLHLSMRAVAPALATGNAVVLKPASNTPITGGLLLARIFEDAGLPEGLLTVVTGHGSDVGDRIAGHDDAAVVSFTGSSAVGSGVASEAAGNFAQPAMELGGNGPHVVLEDADVDDAVDAGTFGTFLHQGQICISINRHLVHESVYDEYVEKLAERAENLPIGNPSEDPEAVVGPIIDDSQVEDITTYIEQTVEEGATLEAGGDHDGRFVEPTVLSDATNEMSAACNEHFGPVAPVIPFSDDEEAVELANDTEYGLAASVFGGDRNRAEDVADRIDAGMVHVNDQPVNDEPHVPFGGMKASGIGRYNGEWVLEEFTEPKWVSVQRETRDYPF